MPKLPGANSPLYRLQALGPLAAYVGAAAALLWAAVLVATGVLAPLQRPEPLDPTKVFARQERVNQAQYTAVTKHFPPPAGVPEVTTNPFGP